MPEEPEGPEGPEEPEAPDAIELASCLAHDVGKYIARMGRNVRSGAPFPRALLPMIVKDLYVSPQGGKPSARFEALAGALEASLGGEVPRELRHAGAAIRGIDGLEARVRAGEEDAVREACALAVQVDHALRALAGRLIEEARTAGAQGERA